jgi:hypothetical protein
MRRSLIAISARETARPEMSRSATIEFLKDSNRLPVRTSSICIALESQLLIAVLRSDFDQGVTPRGPALSRARLTSIFTPLSGVYLYLNRQGEKALIL